MDNNQLNAFFLGESRRLYNDIVDTEHRLFALYRVRKRMIAMVDELSDIPSMLDNYNELMKEDSGIIDGDDTCSVLEDMGTYIKSEYIVGKESGRNMQSLFRKLVSMIGEKELLEFDKQFN